MAAQTRDELAIAIRPSFDARELVLAHPEPDVRVEVVLEPSGLDERPLRRPPLTVALRRGVRRPADRDHRARPIARVTRDPEPERAAHRRAAPHRLVDPQRVEPEQQVGRLARVGVVVDVLEAGRETVAAGIGKERAHAIEERLEVGHHHRRVFDGATVHPHDRWPVGDARLAPVQANAVGQHPII